MYIIQNNVDAPAKIRTWSLALGKRDVVLYTTGAYVLSRIRTYNFSLEG